jgi:hypothetical protein
MRIVEHHRVEQHRGSLVSRGGNPQPDARHVRQQDSKGNLHRWYALNLAVRLLKDL